MTPLITASPSSKEALPYFVSEIAPSVITAILIAIVFAGVRALRPVSRWRHAAKRDGAILAALPNGDEKTEWKQIVEHQAAAIRYYQDLERRWIPRITEMVVTIGLTVGLTIAAIFYFGLANSWKEFLDNLSIFTTPAIAGGLLWIALAIANKVAKANAKKQPGGNASGRMGKAEEPQAQEN